MELENIAQTAATIGVTVGLSAAALAALATLATGIQTIISGNQEYRMQKWEYQDEKQSPQRYLFSELELEKPSRMKTYKEVLQNILLPNKRCHDQEDYQNSI